MRLLILFAVLALSGCQDPAERAADAANFHLAIDASNEATRITNRFTTTGTVPTEADRAAIRLQTNLALEHAIMVRDRSLAHMHDDMPRVFHDRFVRGLRTVSRGLDERSPELMADGHEHLEKWADWLEAHAHEIRFPPPPASMAASR
jgi:hypothetical protein